MLSSLIHKNCQFPILQKIYTGALWKMYVEFEQQEELASATESLVEYFARENCDGNSHLNYLSLWVKISRSTILNDQKELSSKTFHGSKWVSLTDCASMLPRLPSLKVSGVEFFSCS